MHSVRCKAAGGRSINHFNDTGKGGQFKIQDVFKPDEDEQEVKSGGD